MTCDASLWANTTAYTLRTAFFNGNMEIRRPKYLIKMQSEMKESFYCSLQVLIIYTGLRCVCVECLPFEEEWCIVLITTVTITTPSRRFLLRLLLAKRCPMGSDRTGTKIKKDNRDWNTPSGRTEDANLQRKLWIASSRHDRRTTVHSARHPSLSSLPAVLHCTNAN